MVINETEKSFSRNSSLIGKSSLRWYKLMSGDQWCLHCWATHHYLSLTLTMHMVHIWLILDHAFYWIWLATIEIVIDYFSLLYYFHTSSLLFFHHSSLSKVVTKLRCDHDFFLHFSAICLFLSLIKEYATCWSCAIFN